MNEIQGNTLRARLAAEIADASDNDKTVLIACAPALPETWSSHILAADPAATVFFYGESSVGGKTYCSFTELKPKPGMSYTFDYLAGVPPGEWKQKRSGPSYFIAAFPSVNHIAERFEQWFDVAIQDECFPNMKIEGISTSLLVAAKRLVRVDLQY